MDASKNLSVNEFENGKYIIVKIPRNSVTENFFNTLAVDQKYRQALRMILYIFTFLMGILVGSIFHDRLLNSSSSRPVWKSSNLMQSDSK
jgi:hypothetical protein